MFTDRGVAIAFSVSEGINEVTSNADSDEVVPKSTSSTSSRDLPQARFWITSGLPTTHPESSMFSNVHADLLGYLVSPAAEWMICASVRIDGGEIKSI